MSTSIKRSRWRTGVSALVATGVLCAAGLVGASSASAADTSTVSVTSSTHWLGGTVHLSGQNWTNTAGTAGSVIGVKLDDGAVSRLPGDTVHANATIWQIVNVPASGVLDVDIELPTGQTTGHNGSTAAFEGDKTHKITLLTGSLLPGDELRSKSVQFTVLAQEPTGPTKPTTASVSLGAVTDGVLPITSSGFAEGTNLYTVKIDDGAKFNVPVSGNSDGSLALSSISLAQYGIGEGNHTLTVSWAADGSTLGGAQSFSVAGPTDPGAPSNQGVVIKAEVEPLNPADGALALSIPGATAGVTLVEGANAGDRRVFTGALPTVTVSDTRNANQAGAGGWSTSGQMGDLTSGGATIGAKYLGWTPKVLTAKTGLAAGSVVATGIGGGNGLSVASSLATATSAGRTGTAELGADLALEIPVDSAAGSYSGNLTVSLFATD